ncbi:MAG: beta strand repeat-containing protein [Bacteroidia bacterium]
MKKLLLLFVYILLYACCMLLSSKAHAQNVGINSTGATANASAGLDVSFTNKGLLIPRVALTGTGDVTTISSAATSLLVYNTATAGAGSTAVTPGYFYWTGSAWTRLISAASSSGLPWQLGGNAGTTPGTNFVGTTDAKDLVFKTNSSESFRIMSTGEIAIGTTSPYEKIHLSGGNVFFDDAVALKGKSSIASTYESNILKVNSSDVEFGSTDPYNQFSSFKFYIPMAGPSATDGKIDVYTSMSYTPLVHIQEDGKIGINQSNPLESIHLSNGNMFFDDAVALKGKSSIASSYESNILKVNSSDVEFGSTDAYNQFSSFKFYIPMAGPSATDGKIDFYTSMSYTPLVHMQEDGKVGFNNSSPAATVDINGTLKLADGTEGLNKVLTSDASGNATWQTPASASSGWNLTGNTGTTAGTNFVGTTDLKDLVIKTNGTERIRVLSTGNVGIGTSAPNQQLEITGNFRLPATTSTTGIIYSGANRYIHSYGSTTNFFAGTGSGNFTMTGAGNVSVGSSTLTNVTTGANNVGIGMLVLSGITSGGDNVAMGSGALSNANIATDDEAIGFFAMNQTTTGSYNVATGDHALQNTTTGTGNIAMGSGAGVTTTSTNSNITGSYNVFLGYESGPGTTTQLSNAIAIGKNALVTASNSMVLGGTGADAVNVGLGNTAPSFKLDVTGTGRFTSTLKVGAYTFPATDGSSGFVLKTNGAGVLTWQADAGGTFSGWGLTGNTGTNDPAAPATYGTSTIAGTENWVGTTDAQDVVIGTNTIERMRVKQTTGYVGIGNAAPAERLSVYGSETAFHGTGACIGLTNTASTNDWFIRAGSATTATPNGGISIADNSNYWFNITGTGNVGIATTSPVSSFEVNGSVGMKVKPGLAAGTTNPDATALAWIYSSGTGTITVPAASSCSGRMYVIVNYTGAARTITGYTSIGGTAGTTTIANASSIWIISDGTNWYQIK